MDIQFHPPTSLESIASLIRSYPNPQVIQWFIGEDGLKVPTIKIHRQLVSYLQDIPITYWLYDLTAWAAFHRPNRRLDQIDSSVPLIVNIKDPQLKVITSADFFTWLQDPSRLTWIQSILADPEIYQVSSTYPDSEIKIGSILPELVEDKDTGKSYSAFQYLEVLYLISKVFSDGTPIFVLPNDESKYYRVGRLASDLKVLGIEKTSVIFLSFTYGTKPSHRPYSGNNKEVKVITRESLGLSVSN